MSWCYKNDRIMAMATEPGLPFRGYQAIARALHVFRNGSDAYRENDGLPRNGAVPLSESALK